MIFFNWVHCVSTNDWWLNKETVCTVYVTLSTFYWKTSLQRITFGRYIHGTQISSQSLIILGVPSQYFFLILPCYQSSNPIQVLIICPHCELFMNICQSLLMAIFQSRLSRKPDMPLGFLPTRNIYFPHCPSGPLLD